MGAERHRLRTDAAMPFKHRGHASARDRFGRGVPRAPRSNGDQVIPSPADPGRRQSSWISQRDDSFASGKRLRAGGRADDAFASRVSTRRATAKATSRWSRLPIGVRSDLLRMPSASSR